MRSARLFRVMVIGGALLGCGTADQGTQPLQQRTQESPPDSGPVFDAGTAADAAAAADAEATVTPDTGVEPSPCICSPTRCCEPGAGGASVVQAGFECCWGTSC